LCYFQAVEHGSEHVLCCRGPVLDAWHQLTDGIEMVIACRCRQMDGSVQMPADSWQETADR
jgi:hypothetical protein